MDVVDDDPLIDESELFGDEPDGPAAETPIAQNRLPGAFAELCKAVASTASVTYTFCMRHEPEDGATAQPVKMSGAAMAAFPIALHEYAYFLPNSSFQSSGAAWTTVPQRPSLKANRTVPSQLIMQTASGEDEWVEVPPHSFSMTPDGNCKLEFANMQLSTIPTLSGPLGSQSARLFATELTDRLSWAATERNKTRLVFGLRRNTLQQGTLDLVERLVEPKDDFAPHEVMLTGLNYSALKTNKFRMDLLDMLRTNEQNMFLVGSPVLPDTKEWEAMYEWELNDVYTMLRERLKLWNDRMKDLDRSEAPFFRNKRKQKRAKMDATNRQALAAYNGPSDGAGQAIRSAQSTQAAQPDGETAGDATNAAGAAGAPDETTHVFFRSTELPCQASQLMRCKITLLRYKAPTKFPEYTGELDLVTVFKQLADRLPDTMTGAGLRWPLLQRLRVLMGQQAQRDLMKEAVDASAGENFEEMRRFVKRAAQTRVLPHVVEGVAVFKQLSDSTELDGHLDTHSRSFDALRGVHAWLKRASTNKAMSELWKTFRTELEAYPRILDRLNEKMQLDPSQPAWIRHGGTRSSVTVSITLSASTYGHTPSSITGATPISTKDYKSALAAALCRILFDPSTATDVSSNFCR